MRVSALKKAFGRARSLTPRELVDVVRRRSGAALRARLAELDAKRLGLDDVTPSFLVRVVRGASTIEGAVALLEQGVGRLPSVTPPSDLLSRADQASAGLWNLLGHRIYLGTTPDWHRDFVSGIRWDPTVPARRQPIVRGDGSDVKVPWELSRLQHLPLVAQAFAQTGKAGYRDLVTFQLRDWIEKKNPPGMGIHWTNAMEVALRAVSMSWAFEFVRSNSAIDRNLRALVFGSLFAHGQFILGHLEDAGAVPGNHYVADLVGLVWLGSLYPAFRAAATWRDEGRARLATHLSTQILPDGGDFEGSMAYHELVRELLTVCRDAGAPELGDTVDRMSRFTGTLRKPDGTLPRFGDDDSGHATPFSILPSTESGETQFPQSGLAMFRHEDLYLLFVASSVGQRGQGGHGHNDKLSFELFCGGDLITDPGTFVYTRDPKARDAFRSTSAHATLQLDGREQNPIPNDVFHLPEAAHARILRCETQPGRFVCEGEHVGFRPFTHRRKVEVVDRRVTITDALLGESSEPHEIAIRFPLAVGLETKLVNRGVEVTRDQTPVLTLSAKDVTWSIEPGFYSPAYDQRVARSIAVARSRVSLPATFTTMLVIHPSKPEPTARS